MQAAQGHTHTSPHTHTESTGALAPDTARLLRRLAANVARGDAVDCTAYGTGRASPRDFWLAPHDLPLPGPDGMRGLPDLRGTTVSCPRSGEAFNVSMQSPRVVHKHGQSVYFCCFGCVSAFWTDPKSLFA